MTERNKYGYDVSEFSELDIKVRRCPETGGLRDMTGSTRESQFKKWLIKTFNCKFDLQKVNSEGLPDFYCFKTGKFFEVKYKEHGGSMPVDSLFSKKQWQFIQNDPSAALVGYRTGKQGWALYKFDYGVWEEVDTI